ncbi:MAG: alkaline phosphatase PhoX [bacterium]
MSPPAAPQRVSRRAVLRAALGGAGLLLGAPLRAAARSPSGAAVALLPPDDNGVRLLPGFSSRVVARTGQLPAVGSTYAWHPSPDGGATFPTADGGWIYVSNSELWAGMGGVAALRFAAGGAVVAAYPICSGTTLNCAGGATPWGTWLTCEEFPSGHVWECDPTGHEPAVIRPALGTFSHEAIAVDLAHRRLYLTEDMPYGRFYRFTAAAAGARLDLSRGLLEVAEVRGEVEGPVRWHAVPDPTAARRSTAEQVAASTVFSGAEGIARHRDTVYFATKYDNRVWAYDTRKETLRVFYDDDRFAEPLLRGVDNVAISPAGDVLVAEDGGSMQIVGITPRGAPYQLLQVTGQIGSEITGPAFDPGGSRLYFSSQRGPWGLFTQGITYEVSGPFARA